MADMHNIEFGGQEIRVPKWASEEQLNRLIALNQDNVKLLRSLDGIAKQHITVVNELIRTNKQFDSGIKEQTKEFVKSLKDVEESIANSQRKDNEEERRRASKREKLDLKNARSFRDAYKDLQRDLGRHFDGLGNSFKDMAKGISGGDFEGFAKAAGSVVGLGAAAGFVTKMTVNFANNLSQLTNVGSGFGVGLVDLRTTAALAGTGLEGLAKIANSNSMTFKALGDNTTQGMMAFARLSNQIRQSGTQMGLTNTEFNDLLSEEIELRRSAGQTERQITQGVNNSFRNLVQETTALASITGADRREMLRARTELADDPGLRRFAASTPQLNGVVSIFSSLGPMGKELSNQLLRSARGQAEFSIFQGVAGGQLADTFGRLGPGAQNLLQEIDGLVNQAVNIDPNDTAALDELNSTLLSKVVQLKDSIPADQLKLLEDRINNLGDNADEQDKAALNFIAAITGISGEQDKILTQLSNQRKKMDEDELPDLAATIEDTTNKLKASAVDAFMDLTGADRDDGNALVQSIDKLGENVMRDGLLGGILSTLGDANGYLKAILFAIGALGAGGAIMGLMGLNKLRKGLVVGGRKVLQKGKSILRPKSAPSVGKTVAKEATGEVAEQAGKTAVKQGAGEVAEQAGKTAAKETAEAVGKNVAKEVAETTAKSATKSLLKKVPGVSIVAGLALGIDRLLEGDFVGAAGEVGSGIAGTIPGFGTAASVAIDAGLLARDIAKVYEEQGVSPEDAQRLGSMDAINQSIAEATDRIKRSEDGENVYWGRESKGIAEDQKNIQELMLAEIQRLNELQKAGNTLTAQEKEQLKKMEEGIKSMDISMDEATALSADGNSLIASSYRDAIAAGNHLQKLDGIDSVNIKEQLDEDGEKTGKYIVTALKDRDMTEREKQLYPKLAQFNNGKIGEETNIEEARTRTLVKVDDELKKSLTAITTDLDKKSPEDKKEQPEVKKEQPEVKKEQPEVKKQTKPALPSDKVLAQHKAIAKQQQAALDEKKSIEAEYGEAKAIGVNEKQAAALLRSGVADSEEDARKQATIYGYEDEEVNKKYQASKKTIRNTENQLRKIERDKRYRAARGREVGRAMGLLEENEYNYTGQFVGNAPASINGVAVGDEFLTERERNSKNASIQTSREMNKTRPTISSQTQTNQTDTKKESNQADSTTSDNKDIIKELQETNRLLRKQTETIENN